MEEVTFPVEVGGDGETYNDGPTPPNNMDNYGYVENWAKLFTNAVAMARTSKDYALSALNAPGTSATSSTPETVGSGTKTFVLNQTGKSFVNGQNLMVAAAADPTNRLVGIITDSSMGSPSFVEVEVTAVQGAANAYSSWIIALEGAPGTAVALVPETRSSDTGAITLEDLGKVIKAIAGYDQSLDEAAAAGEGTFVTFWNGSDELVTLSAATGSSPAETIDGQTFINVYPGESFTLRCNGSTGWDTIDRRTGAWLQVAAGSFASGGSTDFTTSFDDPELDAWELALNGVSGTNSGSLSLSYIADLGASPQSWVPAAMFTQDFSGAGVSSSSSDSEFANFNAASDLADGWIKLTRAAENGRCFLETKSYVSSGADKQGRLGIAAVEGLRLTLQSGTFDAGAWTLHARRRAI